MGKRGSPCENEHHNVPGSRGGSGKKVNLSLLPISRHNGFHQWAENCTPCEVLRKFAVQGIGLEDRNMLPPTALEDFLVRLRCAQWTDVYDPDAILWLQNQEDQKNQKKLARMYSAAGYFKRELREIRRTIKALCDGTSFSGQSDTKKFVEKGLLFFGASSQREAMQSILQERYRGEYSWVKPMQSVVRGDLIQILDSAVPIPRIRKHTHALVDILRSQEAHTISQILGESGIST